MSAGRTDLTADHRYPNVSSFDSRCQCNSHSVHHFGRARAVHGSISLLQQGAPPDPCLTHQVVHLLRRPLVVVPVTLLLLALGLLHPLLCGPRGSCGWTIHDEGIRGSLRGSHHSFLGIGVQIDGTMCMAGAGPPDEAEHDVVAHDVGSFTARCQLVCTRDTSWHT
jgi:hypothetical protein